MIDVVVIVEGPDEAIGETGLAHTDLTTILLRPRHPHHRHIDLFLRQDLLLQILPYLLHLDSATFRVSGSQFEGF